MAGGTRWLAVLTLCCLLWALPALSQDSTPPPTPPETPTTLTGDAARLLELGKLFMGKNNPRYAAKPEKLEPEERSTAGAQALNTFRMLVKLYPQHAEGWMWLGIALTETLTYSKKAPQGEAQPKKDDINEGLEAFRNAVQRAPTNIDCVRYYGDALMTFRRDFDAARKLWDSYLQMATTDLERVTALVQSARASLNKAYFGKANKMPTDEIRKNYLDAENTVALAAKLCPKAADVKQMQALLLQYRKLLYGSEPPK